MPVAHLNGTELFYVEVGEGTPCLVMHGGLGFDHTCLHPLLDLWATLCTWSTTTTAATVDRADRLRRLRATHDRRTFHGHARPLPTFAPSPS